LLPFIFTAFSMDAGGQSGWRRGARSAPAVNRKARHLAREDKPDYGTCVDIVTKALCARNDVPALLPSPLSLRSP